MVVFKSLKKAQTQLVFAGYLTTEPYFSKIFRRSMLVRLNGRLDTYAVFRMGLLATLMILIFVYKQFVPVCLQTNLFEFRREKEMSKFYTEKNSFANQPRLRVLLHHLYE